MGRKHYNDRHQKDGYNVDNTQNNTGDKPKYKIEINNQFNYVELESKLLN